MTQTIYLLSSAVLAVTISDKDPSPLDVNARIPTSYAVNFKRFLISAALVRGLHSLATKEVLTCPDILYKIL